MFEGDAMERNMRRRELWNLRTRLSGVFSANGSGFWLTRRGDSDDYVLAAGERLLLPAGEWLVEALGEGCAEWTTAVSTPVRVSHATDRLSSVSGF